ncbi:MAG: SPOR domain-containing protein [Treponema sp.]|nr:SPOR domain-containing protein [Treponema sp.]
MEQKKTLWIVAASGVFLLVVIGAALLLNAPSSNAPATASITTIDTTPVTAKVEEPVISPVETPASTSALDSNTLAFQSVENGEPAAGSAAVDGQVAAATPAPAQTTIELNANSSSAVTATSRAGQEALSNAGAKSTASTIYTGNPGASEASKTVAAAPAKSSSAAPKKKVSAPAPKAPALSSKYWVQAASFTNKKSADSARAALDDNKIPAEVFTYKDNKDKLFYRVRVGPYTTKSEAEYWKTRVCKIDLFKDTQSYVTEIKM